MRSACLCLGVILIGIFTAPSPGGGPEISPSAADEWTVITCDGNLFLDYDRNQATFYRNVLIKNPRGSLKADRLVIFFSPEGKEIEKAEAYGHIWVHMGGKTGTSQKIVYYPARKQAILLGEAEVTSGENTVRGGKITFHLDREEMVVEDAPDVIITPDKDYDVQF